MLTPYLENGQLDFEGLSQLIECYLHAGASGLFANCQSSEMFELSGEESLSLIAHVVKQTKGRVPVVAASSIKGSISEQASFVKKVYALGVEAVILITGLLAAEDESDEQFNQRVFELFDLTENIPLGFYECPEPYKRVLSASQLSIFVNTGRIIYHKDTCLNLNQVKDKLAATKGRSFGLYDAYMVNAVASLKAGAAGLSCIQGNYFPELIVWLCDHYHREDLLQEVEQVQQFLFDNMDMMHHVYPVTAKYFLQKRGVPITLVSRRDVGVFDESIRAKQDELYNNYMILAERIGLVTTLSFLNIDAN